jgi:hypothetical protein
VKDRRKHMQMRTLVFCAAFIGSALNALSETRVSYTELPFRFQPNGPHGSASTRYTGFGGGYQISLSTGGVRIANLQFRFEGANRNPRVTGLDPLPGRTSYLEGNDRRAWRTGIVSYGRVRYSAIYPGIDLVFYGNPNRLEYDFVVAPGADLERVLLAIDGAESVRLDGAGDLIVATAEGEVSLRRPSIYQTVGGKLREIAGGFRLKGNQAAFQVANYDHNRPLIVDPVLSYATYVGRSVNDKVNAIAVGSDGSSYVAGVTPAGAASASGHDEAFVAHISSDGKTLLSMTYLAGAGATDARGITVDPTGLIYVTGKTKAKDFPVLYAIQPRCGGECSGNAWIARLNPDGSPNFATYLGGSGEDAANAIALDSAGNVYVAGSAASTNFPVIGAAQYGTGGSGDAFVAKLAGDGTRVLYATYLGGGGKEEAYGIAVDAKFSAYVTGLTQSIDFPTRNPHQAQCKLNPSGQCAGEAFVTKLSADGSAWVWSTYLGGSGGDSGAGIALDTAGAAYVAGTTASDDFPTVSAFQAKGAGMNDAFVSKFTADGTKLLYSTYLGGSRDDRATSIAVDRQGRVYVGGHTISTDFPTKEPVQAACHADTKSACTQDAFLSVLDAAGTGLNFSSYLGGAGADEGRGLALDAAGTAYLGGATTSNDFPLAAPRRGKSGAARNLPAGGGIVAAVKLPQSSQTSCSGTNNWTGAAGDNQWTTSGNWSTGAVPGSTDQVCIGSAFTGVTVTIPALATANEDIASLVSNANINITGGPLTVAGSANFVNNLSINQSVGGSDLILNGSNGSIVGGTLTLNGGGILAGTDTMTINGLFTWTSGTICGTSNCLAPTGPQPAINANGGLTCQSCNLYGRTLNNAGNANFSGAGMNLVYGATVNNLANATWSMVPGSTVFAGSGTGSTFNNAGTFQTEAGGSTFGIQGPVFNNSGSVLANAVQSIFTGGYTQTAGSTVLGGGSIAFASSPSIQGGTISGSGTISSYANYTGAILTSPAGIIAPGIASPTPVIGSFAFSGTGSGNYTQGTGSLNIKIGGTGAGQYDTVTASGTVTLGGTLNVTLVNGFIPAAGSTFTILTAGTLNSTKFATTNLPSLPPSLSWQLTYTTTSVLLCVRTAVPAVTLSTTSLTFPDTIVGTTSAVMTVSLDNTGNAPLTIASIAPTGADGGNYAYTPDASKPCPISPATLAAGAACTIDVTFKPLSSGTHNSAAITITDNNGNVLGSTQTIALNGTGIILTSIAITAANTTLTSGETEQFTATGTYSDNSTADVTNKVTWTSSDTKAATISSTGFLTAGRSGTTTITATLSGVTSNQFTVTVKRSRR